MRGRAAPPARRAAPPSDRREPTRRRGRPRRQRPRAALRRPCPHSRRRLRAGRWSFALGPAARRGRGAAPGALAPPPHRAGQPAQRLRELRRDHPDLVRLALGELRQHLQVLVAEQLGVRVARVDRARRPCRSPSPRPRRAGSPPLGALRLEHRGLLLALGGQDLRLLDALGGEDRRAAVALGAHLLLHRLLDRRRRVDRLELDAVDADPPLARRARRARRAAGC